VEADFLTTFRCSKNCFSFCFANPPYLNGEGKERTEKQFLEKATNYMVKEGIAVWVIPHRVYEEDTFLRFWVTRYEPLGEWRFRDAEYSKWQQVVIVGRKRPTILPTMLKEEFAVWKERAKLENISILPIVFSENEQIKVPVSDPAEVKTFSSTEFHPEEALGRLVEKGMGELDKVFLKRVPVKPYVANQVGRPPIPLKKDSLYLLAVSGAGQGAAGEEGIDLHLQRGHAEVVEDVTHETDEKGISVQKVTSRTQITMSIIETDGTITRLQ